MPGSPRGTEPGCGGGLLPVTRRNPRFCAQKLAVSTGLCRRLHQSSRGLCEGKGRGFETLGQVHLLSGLSRLPQRGSAT